MTEATQTKQMSSNARVYEFGDPVHVVVDNQIVQATYIEYAERYKNHKVRYQGRVYYKQIVSEEGRKLTTPQGGSLPSSLTAVKPSRFSISQRFQFIEDLVDMVINNKSRALIITGSGGLGKTYTVMKQLSNAGLLDIDDLLGGMDMDMDTDGVEEVSNSYKVIKGFATAKALYRAMWRNNGRIIVFDDCDSVWDNPVSLNIMKSALDSYEKRRVSWFSEIRSKEEDLPLSFEFTGRIVFISNRGLNELDQAVLSRCLYVDVSMTPTEKIERIKAIMPNVRPDLPEQHKRDALEVLEKFKDEIGDLNVRTFLKILDIREDGNPEWRDLAEYVITAM